MTALPLQQIKAIHKRLRDAGYERQNQTHIVGPKVYKTYIFPNGKMSIKIPGNWAISLRDKYRDELMVLFADMSPVDNLGLTGIIVQLDVPTPSHDVNPPA